MQTPIGSFLVFKALPTLFAAAVAVGSPASAEEKGYRLSPLETFLIDAFAQEQIDGFVKTGTSSLFENPKVYYLQTRYFAKMASESGKKLRDQYIGNYAIINAHVSKMTTDREIFYYSVRKPPFTIELSLSKDADRSLLKEVYPSARAGFYCRIQDIKDHSAKLTDCLPLKQFADRKEKQIRQIIDSYLRGEKIKDPNIPTYAMMAYMGIVSAKLLPKDSVCRTTVLEEVDFTPAERRLCTQEVAELWQNAGSIPDFDSVMDQVEDQLHKSGVDVEPIKQAASALD